MSDPYEADFVDEDENVEEPTEDEFEEPDLEAPEEEPSGEDDEEPSPRPRTRGENRVAAATRIAAEAKREAEALRAEMAALRNAQSQPSETAAQRQARLAEMEPWERTELLQNERMARLEHDLTERADKSAFEALCARDPIAAKMKDDVERELSALRARGQNVDRDTMLTFLLGQRARANSGRATSRAARTAAANRERNTTRPGSGRSDTPAADRREANTKAQRDKRLENYQL